MSRRQTLLKGTLILTATGVATRIMGFFYRIFLSRVFHSEGMGMYQLIFPVYALCFSLTSAGIEVALSRIVATYVSTHNTEKAVQVLRTSLVITVSLSVITMLLMQKNAEIIAIHVLNDERCGTLLYLMTYALPFSAIHSCICGYYFGMKQTKIPAVSQLFEQLIRIASVWMMFRLNLHASFPAPVAIAVLGLVCGEIAASLYSIFSLRAIFTGTNGSISGYISETCELLRLSTPLTANRILLNLLQSFEAVSIPAKLQSYGLSFSDALGTYGILTGMALPCILFPSAITNSVSTMLLPTVAEIQSTSDKSQIRLLIKKVCSFVFFLGLFCMFGFFIFARPIGDLLFHNERAGNFILTLAFICPFLYVNSTLISIINGLGKTSVSFFINSLGLLIRIGSVFLLIPLFGILGYLWGLLASQFIVSLFCLLFLFYYLKG